jgi:hypothetical protein
MLGTLPGLVNWKRFLGSVGAARILVSTNIDGVERGFATY